MQTNPAFYDIWTEDRSDYLHTRRLPSFSENGSCIFQAHQSVRNIFNESFPIFHRIGLDCSFPTGMHSQTTGLLMGFLS